MAFKQIPTGRDPSQEDLLGPEHQFLDFMEFSDAGPEAEFGLPLIWRQALAVATGIGGQAYMGILHPPATGLAFAFATSEALTWGSIWPVLVLDVMMVIMAMMILNLSEKQQYPLWWLGLGYASTGGSRKYLTNVVRREWRRLRGQ